MNRRGGIDNLHISANGISEKHSESAAADKKALIFNTVVTTTLII